LFVICGADDPLGNVSVSVDDLFKDEEKLQWYNLHNTKHGEIQVPCVF
jgi:hypothetical protein